MESPLLEGGPAAQPSSSDPAPSPPKQIAINRRGVALKTGSGIQQAAALVDIAYDGEGLALSLIDPSDFARKAYLYLLHNAAHPLWLATYAALLLLNFVEIPSWCSGRGPQPCGDPKEFWLGDVPYLPASTFLIVEAVIFLLLAVHIVFPLVFTGLRLFKESVKDAVSAGLLLLLGLDILRAVLFHWGFFSEGDSPAFRLAPYLRILLILVSVHEIREHLWTVMAILPKFSDIFLLGVIFLAFWAWLAYVLFEDTSQGKEFSTYSTTFFKMFVILTGSNNPDAWQPAYEKHRAYSLFFVLFLLLGIYFIVNLVLAVIFDSFKEQLGAARKRVSEKKRKVLCRAFALIDDSKRGYIDSDQFTDLLHALNLYRAVPHIQKGDMEHMFMALDDSGDYKLDEAEFLDLVEALGTKFIKVDEPPFLQVYAPSLWHSRAFAAVRDFVKDPRFDQYVMTAVLLANLVTVAIETALDLRNLPSQAVWQNIEYVFGWIYVVEVLLKIASLGFSNYWRQGANRFDFFITWIILIGQTTLILDPTETVASKEWIRYLLIGRMLRLLRLLTYVGRYRVIVNTFLKLIPAMGPLCGVFFGFLSLFTSLGVHLFGGLVYEGNPLLHGSPLNKYKPYNFNDYSSGIVTLFTLLCEAAWEQWMEGYAVLSGTRALSRAFFVGFMCTGTYLVMNVFVSFVMGAFDTEMELEMAEMKDKSKQKGGRLDLSTSRHGANIRAEMSPMEQLMDRMFGEDDGPRNGGDSGV